LEITTTTTTTVSLGNYNNNNNRMSWKLQQQQPNVVEIKTPRILHHFEGEQAPFSAAFHLGPMLYDFVL
jgi:hypothetical protein